MREGDRLADVRRGRRECQTVVAPRPSQLAPAPTREGWRGVSPDRVSGSGEAAVARGARRRRPNQSGETDTSKKSLRSDKSQGGFQLETRSRIQSDRLGLTDPGRV